MSDLTKPIYFRPSERDVQVLRLIAERNPIWADSGVDLVRFALQAYVVQYGAQSEGARIERMESALVAVGDRLALLERSLVEMRRESRGV